jgi:hypothetical protein
MARLDLAFAFHTDQEEANMKEGRMTLILQCIAREKVPDSVDLWPAIEARLQTPRARPRWGQLVPSTRLGWASLVVALFLALGAVAYAASPAVARLFQHEPGLEYVAQADLVQELALSQSVDGVTVALERAYADANRIIVGFMVQDADDQRRYRPRHLKLTDAAGTVFRGTFGYGVTGQSDLFGVSLSPGEGAYVYNFDASAVIGTPENLELRLVVELEESALPPDAVRPSAAPTGPPAESPQPGVAGHVVGYLRSSPDEPPQPIVTGLQSTPVGVVVGPFAFDFSLPLIPGRTVDVQQTAEAAGVAITLEKVVVTPSEMQATLCLVPPDASREWLLIADGGEDRYGGTTSALGERGAECHRLIYWGALTGRFGKGTLKVTELVGFDPTGQGGQTRLAGPWVFHFRLP